MNRLIQRAAELRPKARRIPTTLVICWLLAAAVLSGHEVYLRKKAEKGLSDLVAASLCTVEYREKNGEKITRMYNCKFFTEEPDDTLENDQ